MHLDPTKRRVYVKGDEKRLTPTEFRLLNALVRHAGAVLSPNQLLTQAWDDPTGIGQERVKFAVLRLRRKLGWTDPDESPIESRPRLRLPLPQGRRRQLSRGSAKVIRSRGRRVDQGCEQHRREEAVRGRPW